MSLTNPFDIGIIIIFGFCMIRGFFRGFVKEVISLIGVLAGPDHEMRGVPVPLDRFVQRELRVADSA